MEKKKQVKIWIKHKDINSQFGINAIFYREDRNSLCIDFNNYKSQIDVFLTPEIAKLLTEDLGKLEKMKKSSGWMITDAVSWMVCPRCRALPGLRCRTPKGKVTNCHGERTSALIKSPEYDDNNYRHRGG